MFSKPHCIKSVKINQDGSTLVTIEHVDKHSGTVPQATVAGVTASPRLAAYTASTISAAAADNSINDSATALPLLLPGEKVLIAGFTGTSANNQLAVVVSSTTAKLVVATPTPLVNDAAGEAVTLTMDPFLSAQDLEGDTSAYRTVALRFAGNVTINPAYCKNDTAFDCPW